MSGHGKLKAKTFGDGNFVIVEIVDDGPGIPREAKSRVFEPFFTTKGMGKGTGLASCGASSRGTEVRSE